MNNKAQVGFAFLLVFFIVVLVLFSTIEPFKEQLDVNRNMSSLNCPGTPGFNQVAYDADDQFNRTVRRPTCFVTGISMVWFVGAVLIAGVVWVVRNWRGKSA